MNTCAFILTAASLLPGFPGIPAGQDAATVRPDGPEYHLHARAVVEEVLSSSEFNRKASGFAAWRRFVRWLEDVLRDISSWIQGLPLWLYWLIVLWMVLALLAILGHLLYVLVGLVGGRERRTKASKCEVDEAEQLFGIRDLEYESVRRRAAELLAAGKWLEAVKNLHVAAILRLDGAGLLSFRPAKTNHDFVRELAPHPNQQAWFGRLTNRFESMVYGGRAADQTRCLEMTAILDSFDHGAATAKI